jgi:hypothetical protein
MKLLQALAGLLPALAVAQTPPADASRRLEAELRLGMERIELPGNEKMGLLGASYLFQVRPGLRVGPAMYGAISGHRGGFFTFGAEGAWRRPVAGPLEAQLGLFAGGGGGGATPVGGGLMWRPHADLLWNFGGYRAGASLSQVRFSNGDISSRQLGLVFSADTRFNYLPLDGGPAAALVAERPGLGFDRVLAVGGAYRPRDGTRSNSGKPLEATIGYVGVRAEQFIAPRLYRGVEANGAVSGGVTGYAEILAGAGAETPIGDHVALGGRAAFGTGGGGAVPTGGGLLVKAALYGAARVSRAIGVSVEGGWAKAPQGELSAPFAAVTLNWLLDPPGSPAGATGPTREEGVVGLEICHDAARNAGPPHTLQNLVFKYNRFVGESAYLTGQVHSAWAGEAGGFFDGLIGAGIQWRSAGAWLLGAEMLVGAAGGGGVDSGSGAVIQPMLYAGWRFTPAISARAGVGRVRSTRGSLDSTVLGLDLSFAFGAGYRN